MSTITINDEIFEDLLHDRRVIGDFSWVTREWGCPLYEQGLSLTPHQVKQRVFASDRVQNAIQKVSTDSGRTVSDVETEAAQILEEMGHNLKMSNIRFLGYLLSKCYKSMYRAMYVNVTGIEHFRKSTSKCPIVLLPTHRSYNDFLLLSYVCFYYKLPLPVTAAGLDFLGMPLVTMLLRNGGGFFMRRSFGSNILYWEIFRQYVQTVLQSKENSVEFFLEGTRSRSGKSLPARTGLLTTIMEMYFNSRVYDISFIPVTLTYDRTLEENLYAYEFLGISKPRESTSGLIKARGILNDDYGNIFIKFSKPISARRFCESLVERTLHSRQPRFVTNITPEEAAAVNSIARYALYQHQGCYVFSAFTLVCVALQTADVKAITFQELQERIRFLKEICELGGSLIFLGTSPHLRDTLETHANMICCDKTGVKLRRSVEARKELSPTLREAVPHMMVYHYANQAMQLLAPYCIAGIILSQPQHFIPDPFDSYVKLRTLLQREFVFYPEALHEEYSRAKAVIERSAPADVLYLTQALRPYIRGQILCCRFLLNYKPTEQPPIKELAKLAQKSAEHYVAANKRDFVVLSLDLINQCFINLIELGAAHKEKSAYLVIHVNDVRRIVEELERYLGERSANDRVAIPSKM